jgi:hypothetical protein
MVTIFDTMIHIRIQVGVYTAALQYGAMLSLVNQDTGVLNLVESKAGVH